MVQGVYISFEKPGTDLIAIAIYAHNTIALSFESFSMSQSRTRDARFKF